MTSEHKIALARIISDIIRADNCLDLSEMDFFEKMQRRYGITAKQLEKALTIDFGEAVNCLRRLSYADQRQIMREFNELMDIDHDRAPAEAMLILAIQRCFDRGNLSSHRLITTDVTDFAIDPGYIIFTDSREATNETIQQRHRDIVNEFGMAGLHFVYIPQITSDYKEIPDSKLKQIIKFLKPSLNSDRIDKIAGDLRDIDTKRFCADYLLGKMRLNELANCVPSILLQVSRSDNRITYLHIDLGNDIVGNLQRFIEDYCALVGNSIRPLTRRRSTDGFVYQGFHKSLFDLMTYPGKKKTSKMKVHTLKKEITFPDLDNKDKLNLSKKEFALYAMILHQCILGKEHKVNINDRDNGEPDRVFNRFYEGHEPADFRDNITPNLSKIRRAIRAIENLENAELYMPVMKNNVIRINISPDLVVDRKDQPILTSDILR